MKRTITGWKQQRVKDIIDQLNDELHPLVVKAVLIAPRGLEMTLTDAARTRMLDDIIKHIHSIASMVIEE